MNMLEQYAKTRLRPPISIRASWKLHMLLWGGGVLLLTACIFSLVAADDYKIQIIAAVGIPFFAVALAIAGAGVWRGRARGLVGFSDEGVWLASLGVQFPWPAIGPAWVMHIKHAGGESHEVFFIIRNVLHYTANIDALGKLFIQISKKSINVGEGGAVDWGLKALFAAGDDSQSFEGMARNMEEMRGRLAKAEDAFAMNIPTPFRLGIPPEHIVALINAETTRRTTGGYHADER